MLLVEVFWQSSSIKNFKVSYLLIEQIYVSTSTFNTSLLMWYWGWVQ